MLSCKAFKHFSFILFDTTAMNFRVLRCEILTFSSSMLEAIIALDKSSGIIILSVCSNVIFLCFKHGVLHNLSFSLLSCFGITI